MSDSGVPAAAWGTLVAGSPDEVDVRTELGGFLVACAVAATSLPILESPLGAGALAEQAPLAGLGVSGTSNGEDLVSLPPADDVLLEPPVDAEPSEESLDERLDRERRGVPRPAVVGFDRARSVENAAERSRFGTVFDNIDGTTTLQLDVEAQHFETAPGRWAKIDPRLLPVPGRPGVFETASSSMVVRVSAAGLEVTGELGETVRMAPGDGSRALDAPRISGGGLIATWASPRRADGGYDACWCWRSQSMGAV